MKHLLFALKNIQDSTLKITDLHTCGHINQFLGVFFTERWSYNISLIVRNSFPTGLGSN